MEGCNLDKNFLPGIIVLFLAIIFITVLVIVSFARIKRFNKELNKRDKTGL